MTSSRVWLAPMLDGILLGWVLVDTCACKLLMRHQTQLRNPPDFNAIMIFGGEGIPRKGSGVQDWASLATISIAKLPLLRVASGKVLTGKLVVGVGTIFEDFEDHEGGLTKHSLYNCLAHRRRRPGLGAADFPKGTRIRVASPYLKLMRSADRGVRVDDPSEIQVDVDRRPDLFQDLAGTREEGRRLFRDGLFQAAAEAYWRGVRAV